MDPFERSKLEQREHRKYEEIFQKLTTDGYLGGKRAVALLGKSGLPQQTLARVWTLADGDVDGRLSMEVSARATEFEFRLRFESTR